jgi:hypothetical protein
MSTGTWHQAGLAGFLAASLLACGHERQARAEPAPAPQPAQQQAARPPPAQAQARPMDLSTAKTQLETARQDVVRAEQQLAEAQRRERQARTDVQQLEIKARQDLERASQLAYQAEQAQGLQSATGRVAQATPSRVLLQLQDGRTMAFQVDDRTRVLIGADQRSVRDIQPGADARVAYDPQGNEPTAVTIRIAPLGSDVGFPPGSPARPPAETPAAPAR